MAVSKRLRYEVLRRDGHTCRYCGRSAPEVRLTVDHVVPVTLGGSDLPENLVTACSECNSGKSATPVDAATVNDVKQDALRWSSAVRQVAQTMVADLERRNQVRDQFQHAWDRWRVDGTPLPLPAGWRDSVDNFVAAGLPVPLLVECVELAMGRRQVSNDHKFRYMCGIAWKRVTELQNAALDHVAVPADAPLVSSGNGDEVLSEMFGAFEWCDRPGEVSSLAAEFSEDDEDHLHWSDFEKAFAQSVFRATGALYEYEQNVWMALNELTAEAKQRYLTAAQHEFDENGCTVEVEEDLARYAILLALRDHPEAEPR